MKKRIFYYDTDSGGVVYYANYLKYLEEARTELLEKKGLSVDIFRQRDILYAVRKCIITYRKPARYGDVVQCTAELKKITAAQLFFDQKVYHESSGQLLVEAEVILVCLNHEFKPVQIPEDLKTQLLSA